MEALSAWAAYAVLASGVLAALGVARIRKGDRVLHPRLMLAAVALAALFLVLYLLKWSLVGTVRYGGPEPGRVPYLVLLLSHTLAATLNVPLVLGAIYAAWRGRWNLHKRWARVAVPVWLYAAATGWLVYWVLARWGVS